LDYQAPEHVYRTSLGGGAIIVDRFGDEARETLEMSRTG